MKKLFFVLVLLPLFSGTLTGCETLRYHLTDPDPVKNVKDRWEAKRKEIDARLDLEEASIQQQIDRYRKTGVLNDLELALEIIRRLK